MLLTRPTTRPLSVTGMWWMFLATIDRSSSNAIDSTGALIGSAAALKSLRVTGNALFAKAVWEGYRNGRKAKWISGEDYLTLLHEPLDAARARLGIATPVAYLHAQRELGPVLASYLSAQKAGAGTGPERIAA